MNFFITVGFYIIGFDQDEIHSLRLSKRFTHVQLLLESIEVVDSLKPCMLSNKK